MFNSSSYPTFVFVNILFASLFSLGIGWVTIRVARRVGLMDIPDILPHKKHTTPVPLAGGLTLFLTLLVGSLAFNRAMLAELWPVLVPAALVFALGLWDDFKRLSARVKLAGQLLAAVLLVLLGTNVQIIPFGFLGLPGDWRLFLNIAITLVWVVGITNAFNFIDSMDGLVVGIGGIAVAFLVLVTLGSSQVALLSLLTLLVGTCAGLYYHNTTPARFFLGDSGAQTIGFLLAAIGIVFTPERYPQGSSWFLPILILGVPIFDTSLVILSRLRRRKPVYQAGRDHTYHRLVALGLDNSRAVASMHIAAILLGCVAFVALNFTPLLATGLFILVVVVAGIFILLLDRIAL